MERIEVLIVGGGPAGSSCAWTLRQHGVDVIVIDKSQFPRDKTCAGWITPQVIETLQLDTDQYARHRTFQPISEFQLSLCDRSPISIRYDKPVSFGIRRCEFDHFLLERAKAETRLGTSIQSLEKVDRGWIVNGTIQVDMLVGAGGHFCPVARRLRVKNSVRRRLVTAREAEFSVLAENSLAPSVRAPQLLFLRDLSGYGWVIPKGNYLNIGLGCVDSRRTAKAVESFVDQLTAAGVLKGDIPAPFHGHAYQLYCGETTGCVDDHVLLAGDAASLAYPQSGEGIRPAVESGILAAQTIIKCRGSYGKWHLQGYQQALESRLGRWRQASRLASRFSEKLGNLVAPWCFSSPWFLREMVLQRWFLHANQPAL